jgi:protein required for attachment to host cells
MKNWLLVANASRARLLEMTDPPQAFRHLADLVHPPSRQKGAELAHDRPGHVEGMGHGLGSTSYIPRTDPREREHDRFAMDLAHKLNDGVAAGSCGGIILVASNPFLGMLCAHLSPQARKAVVRTVAHDYTSLTDADLAMRLPH